MIKTPNPEQENISSSSIYVNPDQDIRPNSGLNSGPNTGLDPGSKPSPLVIPNDYLKLTQTLSRVNYNKNTPTYILYDCDSNIIGTIQLNNIVKYLTHLYISNFNVDPYNDIFTLIEKYICVCSYNPISKLNQITSSKQIKLNLLSDNKSQFMNNISLMIHMYHNFSTYVKTHIQNILKDFLDIDVKKNIVSIIKQFIYLLLTHILKLCVVISSRLKTIGPENSGIKNDILKCSLFINNKLTQIIDKEINNKINMILTNNNDSEKLFNTKKVLDNKITQLINNIQEQNNLIKDIVKNN